ncbi:MAG TPA: type II secretion system protein [Candidatus Paceibacterota bacterium]|nr:type II secretion system protein [Candidatus Paceibacterota bacterium]
MNLAPTRGHRGFTLIELLVVIAIIGILSAVVLASLNSARTKGVDAAVKSNLATIQTQAELYYDDNNNAYGTTAHTLTNCNLSATGNMFANATIKSAIQNATSTLGGPSVFCQVTTGTNSAFMVYAPLKDTTNGQRYYCVDSFGRATTTATVPTAISGTTGGCPS